ncbi:MULTISPECIES: hypothetical protein [Paenibacillus]|uniref:Uncharacterized protein n=1 Tax=Paenibacillus glycanilyticus TaxID=126569 RepID=A0ABQ6NPS2_9BACL|nr:MULTISPECIES: hypothetical protein [Paenibacillus]MCK9857476.1 hypothetical protein [Paenibacillus sp. ATY16]GMK46157.1 hypothetical protein PghCCS26_32860 [Paenibacillus glycanilyticus]
MFQSSMKLDEVRVIGKERAIEQLKFLVVQQIRAAGEEEMNYRRSISETEQDLIVAAILK